MDSEIETRAYWVRLGTDGIVYIRARPQVDVDRADAVDCIRVVGTLCDGAPRPALVDLNAVKSISREARVYFAGPETAKSESAVAIVIKSPLTRAIGNFFMGLNKPVIPTHLFTSEAEALVWLRTFPT